MSPAERRRKRHAGPSRIAVVPREGHEVVRGDSQASKDRLPHHARHDRRASTNLARNTAAQGRGKVPHRVMQENPTGDRTGRRGHVRDLVQERKGRRPGTPKRLMRERDEPTTPRARAAVFQTLGLLRLTGGIAVGG